MIFSPFNPLPINLIIPPHLYPIRTHFISKKVSLSNTKHPYLLIPFGVLDSKTYCRSPYPYSTQKPIAGLHDPYSTQKPIAGLHIPTQHKNLLQVSISLLNTKTYCRSPYPYSTQKPIAGLHIPTQHKKNKKIYV